MLERQLSQRVEKDENHNLQVGRVVRIPLDQASVEGVRALEPTASAEHKNTYNARNGSLESSGLDLTVESCVVSSTSCQQDAMDAASMDQPAKPLVGGDSTPAVQQSNLEEGKHEVREPSQTDVVASNEIKEAMLVDELPAKLTAEEPNLMDPLAGQVETVNLVDSQLISKKSVKIHELDESSQAIDDEMDPLPSSSEEISLGMSLEHQMLLGGKLSTHEVANNESVEHIANFIKKSYTSQQMVETKSKENIKKRLSFTEHPQQKKKRKTISQRSGLIFPVSRMLNKLKKGRYSRHVGIGAGVYMAAVLEYLAAEVLELAGNFSTFYGRVRITPRSILLTIKHDSELDKLTSGIIIPEGGVRPNIHPALLSHAGQSKQSSSLPGVLVASLPKQAGD